MEMKLFNLYVDVKGKKAVQKIMLVAEKANNTEHGEPVHLIKMFMYNEKEGYGYDWNPELPGRRPRKDGKYRQVGHYKSLVHLMEQFRDEVQAYIESEY